MRVAELLSTRLSAHPIHANPCVVVRKDAHRGTLCAYISGTIAFSLARTTRFCLRRLMRTGVACNQLAGVQGDVETGLLSVSSVAAKNLKKMQVCLDTRRGLYCHFYSPVSSRFVAAEQINGLPVIRVLDHHDNMEQ